MRPVDGMYNAQLNQLVRGAESTLKLDEAKRARPILCVDAGSGTLDDLKEITFLLCFPGGESPRSSRLWASVLRNRSEQQACPKI
jgi:hypothetical protein